MVWGVDGPVLTETATIWTPQEPAARPKQVTFAGAGEEDFGLVVQDLRSGAARAVLDPLSGGIAFAASSPGTAFVWARACLGLFETVCFFDLHRVTLDSGADQIVAVTDSAAPVAVTPDGERVAIAARDGIFVRDLP